VTAKMGANQTEVNTEFCGDVCVVSISGPLDAVTSPQFGAHAVKAVCDQYGPVLVDVSGVTFIDACGAQTLATVIRAIPVWQLVAIRARPAVRHALGLCGLDAEDPAGQAETNPEHRPPELVARVRAARFSAAEVMSKTAKLMSELAHTHAHVAIVREQLARRRPHDAAHLLALSNVARSRARRYRQRAIASDSYTCRGAQSEGAPGLS
jgi:anti-sigma B factor antagonist